VYLLIIGIIISFSIVKILIYSDILKFKYLIISLLNKV